MPSASTQSAGSHRIGWWLALLLVAAAVFLNQIRALPDTDSGTAVAHGFSSAKALEHVKKLSSSPRIGGTSSWRQARSYLAKELQSLGFSVQTQNTLITDGHHLRAQKVHNLLARLPANTPATDSGDALLLMAHYDSVPRSPGAGDDASGLAAVLESLRAWLAENPIRRHDVMVLFSDAEENGLLGARAFVEQHPWFKSVRLVINLDNRGSGGPAYLLLETKQGNRQLVEHMARADLPRPNTSSLAYSVYRWLPNDTDLSVFHTDGRDISGYNIAFIGDPFDYHTPLDNARRLDMDSLAHQGENLLPLLRYFNTVDALRSHAREDSIFFSIPLWGGLIHFPQKWAYPMALVILLAGLVVILWGIRKKSLPLRTFWQAALPLVQTLVLTTLIIRFGWRLVQSLNPHFVDMGLGFPYSGYWWMAFFLFLSACISLFIWWRWLNKEESNTRTTRLNAAVATALLIWLLLDALLLTILPGAFFLWLLPLSLLLILALRLRHRLTPLWWAIATLGSGLVLAPVLWQLPVAMGLSALFAVAGLLALAIPLFLPLMAALSPRTARPWLVLCLIGAGIFVLAQWHSGISPEQPQQNSLFYLQDNRNRTAWWLSLDTADDPWKAGIMGENVRKSGPFSHIDNRYGPWITQAATAPFAAIPGFAVDHFQLEKIKAAQPEYRLTMTLTPLRRVSRVDLVTSTAVTIHSMRLNGANFTLKPAGITRQPGQSILRYWFENQESLGIEITFTSTQAPHFQLYGLSGDLMRNAALNIPPRPKTLVSRPSKITDSIITRQPLPNQNSTQKAAPVRPPAPQRQKNKSQRHAKQQ